MAGPTSPPAAHPPLEGRARAIVTLALSLATFMQVLDTTIANVAIPTIAGDLGASTSQGTWVITSFGVANAIAVPITGWLARRVGEVRLFMLSALGFILTSALCGVAPSLETLILFRVLQGAVAGPMIPLSQSLLLAAYPVEKKGMALALWSMTVIVAPIFGPILGGWFSDNLHWSWIFFINVPIGMLALWLAWPIIKHRETATTALPIDRLGLILLVLGVGSLQIMLDKGKELDWFASGEIVVLTVVAVVALLALVIWELTDKHPVIDLSLFRQRNFTVGVVAISLGYMVYFGTILLLPLMLQTQLGYTATQAGLAAAPIGILPVLLSPIIGKNAHHWDLRWVATVSFVTFALCFFWRTTFSPDMDYAYVVWPQFVQGIGIACFFMPLTAISLSGLRPDQIAAASSLSNFLRTQAGAIGASIIPTLWDRREAVHHVDLSAPLDPYNPALAQTLDGYRAAGFSDGQSLGLVAREIGKQAYLIGSNEIFWLSGILFLFLVVLIWFARPPFGAGNAGGADH